MTPEQANEEFQEMYAELAIGGIDLGHGVRIRFYERDGVRAGFNEFHKTPEGRWCAGGVHFDIPEMAGIPGAKWTLNSIDPLDISPSVHCLACGHHGFIKQGRWVPC